MLLFALSFLPPGGVFAAPGDLATPIAPEPPAQDEEIGAFAAEFDAVFSEESLSAQPGSRVSYSITFYVPEAGNYRFRITRPRYDNPPYLIYIGTSVPSIGGSIRQCGFETPNDDLVGAIDAVGPGTCTFSLYVTVHSSTPPGTSFTSHAYFPDGESPVLQDSITITVLPLESGPTGYFDPPSYAGRPGDVINAMFYFNVPGEPGGEISFASNGIESTDIQVKIYTIYRPVHFTCRYSTDFNPTIEYYFFSPSAPGYCQFELEIHIDPDAPPQTGSISVVVGGVTLDTADVTVLDSANYANFDKVAYSAAPDSTTTANLTVDFEDASPGTELVTIHNPDKDRLSFTYVSVEQDSGVTCEYSSTDGDGNLIIETSSTATGIGCKITFDINVLPGAPPGVLPSSITASRTGVGFAQDPDALFEVLASSQPSATFNPATLSSKPGTSIENASVTYAIPVAGSWDQTITLPDGWTFTNVEAPTSTGSVTCGTSTTSGNSFTSNLASTGVDSTCSYVFDIVIPADAEWTDFSVNATLDGVTVPVGSANITVTAPVATASFTPATYSAFPGQSFNASFTIGVDAGSHNVNYQILNPDSNSLTFADPVITPTGGMTCPAPSVTTAGISGSYSSTAAGSCTFSWQVSVASTAAEGQSLTIDTAVDSVASDPSAVVNILSPADAVGAFDQAAYSAMPGASFDATFSISFTDFNGGGNFTIVNPDPSVLTFSDASSQQTDGGACAGVIIDSGNITGTASATAAGSCDVSFTVTVATGAAPGIVGNLTATIPGNNPVNPASISVLQPLTVQPLHFDISAGKTLNGDLATAISGGFPPYTFTVITEPTQGDLTLNTDGTFTYTANASASGGDSFTYSVTDSEQAQITNAAVVTGTVTFAIAAAPTPTPTEPDINPQPTPVDPDITPTQVPTGPALDPTATSSAPARTPGPMPTATSVSGDDTGDAGGGTGVSELPSTGTSSDTGGSLPAMIAMLLLALLTFSTAAILSRRRTRQHRVH